MYAQWQVNTIYFIPSKVTVCCIKEFVVLVSEENNLLK